ncbi:flagellar hook-length control protein FliK [Desulfobacula sp.]|uniref:flagellar hook-length control protein FliK n=1 Tax=Desulfobacula sp. TaxID=2593537 RepID=UPI00262ACF6D|nr:flagellar hook-length control protein FliK [Desulfobacula sp.]
MNFTVADVGCSLLSRVQPDDSRGILLDRQGADSRKQMGDERFIEMLEKAEALGEESRFCPPLNPATDAYDKQSNRLSEELSREKGVGFVSALKNILLTASGGNLSNISIDAQGLDTLKKLLLKAGFAQTDINDLITDISGELAAGDLTLDVLFDKLFELSLEELSPSGTGQENYLESSAIPFIESILSSLGIPRERIQEILVEADKGHNGISLDSVIKHLQSLQKQSFYTQHQYQTPEGDDTFRLVARQLGIEQGGSGISPLTLDDVVRSLENLREKISQQQPMAEGKNHNDQKPIANEKSLDLVNALFKGLKIENKTADTSLKFRVKEMESLLDGKKSETNDMVRQIKPAGKPFSDHSQMSPVETKPAASPSGKEKSTSSFKNLPTYVTHQVGKSLVRALNQGESTLRIQLKPRELGRLVMTIDNTGNSLKVNIMTENPVAKDLLTSNVNELRTVLTTSGVTLERFDVDMNSDFRQSMADAGNQAGNSGRRYRNKKKIAFDAVNGEGVNGPAGLLDAFSQDGALHCVA